jgi:prefoldin subunit 2
LNACLACLACLLAVAVTVINSLVQRAIIASHSPKNPTPPNVLKMPPKASPQKISPQDVPILFQRFRTELQNLAQKIGELESELEEHA